MRKLTNIFMLSAVALIIVSCAGSRSAAGEGSSSNDSIRLGGDRNIVGSSNTPGTFRTGNYGQASLAITATPNTTGPSPSPRDLADYDARSFIIEAVQRTMSELRLSKLTILRSRNENIKSYAAGIVEDYNTIDNGLQSLALSKKLSLSELVNADQLNDKINELNNTRDDQFDKQYLKMITREHQNAADIFKNGVKSTDPAIKSYAGKYLPVIKIHLKNAGTLKPVINK